MLPYIRDWAAAGARYTGAQVFDGVSPDGGDAGCRRRRARGLRFRAVAGRALRRLRRRLASPIHDPERPFEHIAFTLPYNMSEQPSASINAGYTAAGLPIGLQITGRRFDDLGVLRIAHAFESLRPAQHPWPNPAA